MKKVENIQPFNLYVYALISLIVTDIVAIIFLVGLIFSRPIIYIVIVILLIMIYLITRAMINCLKYYVSKEECYCKNKMLIYERILFKKFLLKKIEIPLMSIQKIIDKGHIPSHNRRQDFLNPLHYIVLFFNYYERILLEMNMRYLYMLSHMEREEKILKNSIMIVTF